MEKVPQFLPAFAGVSVVDWHDTTSLSKAVAPNIRVGTDPWSEPEFVKAGWYDPAAVNFRETQGLKSALAGVSAGVVKPLIALRLSRCGTRGFGR